MQTIATSFVSLRFLWFCLNFHFAQLLVRSLWLFACWFLFLLLCLFVWYYRSMICLLLVVCSFAVCMFCVVFVFESNCCLSFCSLLVNMMFVFSCYKDTPFRSYIYSFCSTVWIFILHSYLFVVFGCLYLGSFFWFCLRLSVATYKVFVCCLLFVVYPCFCYVFCCCWRTFVCQGSSFLLIWCVWFQFANNSHVVRIILISVVSFEVPFCTGTYS